MTTSICPSAAMPTIAASGSIALNELLVSVCGATSSQTTASRPVAIQIVTKRDEKRRLLKTDARPRLEAAAMPLPTGNYAPAFLARPVWTSNASAESARISACATVKADSTACSASAASASATASMIGRL